MLAVPGGHGQGKLFNVRVSSKRIEGFRRASWVPCGLGWGRPGAGEVLGSLGNPHIDHAHIGPGLTREGVDAGAARHEVGHHLTGYVLGILADSLGHDSVVRRHDDDDLVSDGGL